MAYSPLTDQQSGRVTEWGATKKSAYVVLIDPTTGLPYVASGGGGGSGFFDLLYTDDTGALFVYRDSGSGAMSAFAVPAGTSYTVGANPRPWSPATQAVIGPLTDAQLRATAVPVSAGSLPLPTGASTEATLQAVRDRLPTALVSNRLQVEPLGVPGVARQQATTTASANVALTAGVARISLFARSAPLRYSVGAASQTANAATSHYLASGERIDIDVPTPTANIAVIRASDATADGAAEITELS